MDRCDLQSRATQTTQTLHGGKLDHARSKSVYPSVMQVDPRQGLAVPELPRSRRSPSWSPRQIALDNKHSRTNIP
jgi:hypothetical protein